MSNKSGAQKVYNHLARLQPGKGITYNRLLKALPALTGGTISGALYRFHVLGILAKSGGGVYTPQDVTFAAYGEKKRWHTKRTTKVRGKAKVSTKPVVLADTQVLNNLLEAMAAAEPILNKYKEVIDMVQSIKT